MKQDMYYCGSDLENSAIMRGGSIVGLDKMLFEGEKSGGVGNGDGWIYSKPIKWAK